MQVKLNQDFFKRGSTWLNVAEAVFAVGIEMAMGLPDGAGAVYIVMRVLMAAIQGIKVEMKS